MLYTIKKMEGQVRHGSSEEIEVRCEVDHDGSTFLDTKFFSKLVEKCQRKYVCEDLEFIKRYGGVCSILKTLESGINNGINM
jgi:hypothetical protein